MYGTYLVENNEKSRVISSFSLARIRIFQNCVVFDRTYVPGIMCKLMKSPNTIVQTDELEHN